MKNLNKIMRLKFNSIINSIESIKLIDSFNSIKSIQPTSLKLFVYKTTKLRISFDFLFSNAAIDRFNKKFLL